MLEVLPVLVDPHLAEAYVRDTIPDVVLLDGLFDSGEAAYNTRLLRAAHPPLKVLVLIRSVEHQLLANCIRAGASGYLTCEGTIAQALAAIKRVHAGELLLAPETVLAWLTQPEPGKSPTALTAREQEVLQAMADGLTVAEAAERMMIAIDTVRTHLKNAKSKLGVRSRLEAVMVGLRAGLVELQTGATAKEPAVFPPLHPTPRPRECGLPHRARPAGWEQASLYR